MKRIVCMGGGPAGLYSAILLKKHLPRARIEVHERNRPDDTFGWGVVFSDKTMANFADADPESHAAIVDSFYHWDDIDVHIHGQMIRSGGHGFSGGVHHRCAGAARCGAAVFGPVRGRGDHRGHPDQPFHLRRFGRLCGRSAFAARRVARGFLGSDGDGGFAFDRKFIRRACVRFNA